jgi:hypothetical protein
MSPKAKLCKNPGTNSDISNLGLEYVASTQNGCVLSPASQRIRRNYKPTAAQKYQRDSLINPIPDAPPVPVPLDPGYIGSTYQDPFTRSQRAPLRDVVKDINPPTGAVNIEDIRRTNPNSYTPLTSGYGQAVEAPYITGNGGGFQVDQSLTSRPENRSTSAPVDSQVLKMTLEEKLAWAIKESVNSGKLNKELQQSLKELLKPDNLKIIAGFIAFYGAAQVVGGPIAAAADAALLLVLGVSVAHDVVKAGKALFGFFSNAENAKTYGDLRKSADNFAVFVNVVGTNGVAAFVGAKGAKALKDMSGAFAKFGGSLSKLTPRVRKVIETGSNLVKDGLQTTKRIGKQIKDDVGKTLGGLDDWLRNFGRKPRTVEGIDIPNRMGGRGSGGSKWKWGADTPPGKLLDFLDAPVNKGGFPLTLLGVNARGFLVQRTHLN